MPVVIAVVADEHVNCVAGLCVGPVPQDGGGTYHPNRTQVAIARAWKEFWDTAVERARERNAELWWVNCGDAVDLNRHDGLSPITKSHEYIVMQMERTYRPLVDITQRRFIVRGTEAHVGAHCELEGVLGQIVDAEVCPADGSRAWWWLVMECEGVKLDFAHHPSTRGFAEWTRHSAVARVAAQEVIRYAERGERVPDLVVRAHVHTASDSGVVRKPRVLFCDGWQALTPFAYARGFTATSGVGGWLLFCEKGTVGVERLFWKPKGVSVWRAS